MRRGARRQDECLRSSEQQRSLTLFIKLFLSPSPTTTWQFIKFHVRTCVYDELSGLIAGRMDGW
jgi:hypothetical protein